MQQLESRHKSELANHFRAQEKELEQLRITCERELERLRTKLKTESDQRVWKLLMYYKFTPDGVASLIRTHCPVVGLDLILYSCMLLL